MYMVKIEVCIRRRAELGMNAEGSRFMRLAKEMKGIFRGQGAKSQHE